MTVREKGSKATVMRRQNYQMLKRVLYRHSPISRVEIAHKLELTTPTITYIITPLIEKGLVREITEHPETPENNSVGRPRIMLEFEPTAYYLCGVDLGPYRISCVLTNLVGEVIAKNQLVSNMDDYDATVQTVVREIPALIRQVGIPREKVLGLGVCLPGLVDGNLGKIYTTYRKSWIDRDLIGDLSTALHMRVALENNVRARVIGADLFDRSVNSEPFAYFYTLFGVACQMVVGGKVLYGQSAAAGEIGHTVVERDGPICENCGNRGCLDAVAGEQAILHRCRSIMLTKTPTILHEICESPEALTIEHVLQAQQCDDKVANLVVRDAVDYLAIALSNTVNLISPRSVMIDARILSLSRNQKQMMEAVEKNIFRVHANKIEFTFLPFDAYRGARGAAALVVKEFLIDNPEL